VGQLTTVNQVVAAGGREIVRTDGYINGANIAPGTLPASNTSTLTLFWGTADVDVGGRLTLGGREPGNAATGSMFDGGFTTGNDNINLTMARLVWRGSSATSSGGNFQLIVQQTSDNTNWVNISDNINVTAPESSKGYATCASPWFTLPNYDTPQLGIEVWSTQLSTYRFGPVYIELKP